MSSPPITTSLRPSADVRVSRGSAAAANFGDAELRLVTLDVLFVQSWKQIEIPPHDIPTDVKCPCA
jgi:hypothetical protein